MKMRACFFAWFFWTLIMISGWANAVINCSSSGTGIGLCYPNFGQTGDSFVTTVRNNFVILNSSIPIATSTPTYTSLNILNWIHAGSSVTAVAGFYGNLTGAASLNVLKTGDTITNNLIVGASVQANVFDGGFLDLTVAAAPVHKEGRIFYDSTAHTLTVYSDTPATSLNVGEEIWVTARNNTANDIDDGKTVYISGSVGGVPTIALAKADAYTTSRLIGVTTMAIPKNTNGKVTVYGIVHDLNTTGFTEGSILYLSPTTAGAFTATRPTAPNYDARIGTSLYEHVNQGDVLVNPDLSVRIGRGTGNQMLGMNSAATEEEYKTFRSTNISVNHTAGFIDLVVSSVPASAISDSLALKVSKAGDTMTGQFTIDGSSLTVVTNSATDGIVIRRNSATAGTQARLNFINGTASGDSVGAYIASERTAGVSSSRLILATTEKVEVSGSQFSVGATTMSIIYGNMGLGRTPLTTYPGHFLQLGNSGITQTFINMVNSNTGVTLVDGFSFGNDANEVAFYQRENLPIRFYNGGTKTLDLAYGGAVAVPGSSFSVGGSTAVFTNGELFISNADRYSTDNNFKGVYAGYRGGGISVSTTKSIFSDNLFHNAAYSSGYGANQTGSGSMMEMSAGTTTWRSSAIATKGWETPLTDLMTLDASGRLGIGIIPSAQLHTDTNDRNIAVAKIGNIDGSYDRGLTVWTADDPRPAGVLTWRPSLDLSVGDTGGQAYAGKMRWSLSATGAAGKTSNTMKLSALSNLDGYTTESDIATFQGNGRVGITDATPDANLEVLATSANTPSSYLLAVSSQNDTTGNIFSVLNNGNVGIGKTPSYPLDVAGIIYNTGVYYQFTGGDAQVYFGKTSGAADYAILGWDGTNKYVTLGAQGNSSNLLMLTNKTGLGGVVPTRTLEVNGPVTASRYEVGGSTVLAVLPSRSLAVGVGAGLVSTAADGTFVGYNAGNAVTTGVDNNFFGSQAGEKNTVGLENNAFGTYALQNNVDGDYNVAVGYAAGRNTTANQNVFVGYAAGNGNVAGVNNVFLGSNAGSAVNGNNNTAIGWQAMMGAGSAASAQNVAIGYQAGAAVTTGSGNTLLGDRAGLTLTTGSNNIIIGNQRDVPAVGTSNHLNIGGLITGTIGSSSVTVHGTLYANAIEAGSVGVPNNVYFQGKDTIGTYRNLLGFGVGGTVVLNQPGAFSTDINPNGGNVTVGSLSSVTTINGNLALKTYTETKSSAAVSTTYDVSWSSGSVYWLSLNDNTTLTFSSAVEGQSLTFFIKQNVGSKAITWPTISWPSATAPTLTTTAGKLDIVTVVYTGGVYYGFLGGQNY